MPNRLSAETSPYLLQHAGNPVAWQPWDADALAEAKRRDVPILVSIGYAACHWCHVMEHESFEDPAIAAVMNEHFVCIKVDREERPDIDALFMDACQAMTGHGGWPLNAFATPDGEPFWAGTYFPPAARGATPSWHNVLTGIAGVWAERRDEAIDAGKRMAPGLVGAARFEPVDSVPAEAIIDSTEEKLRQRFDPINGGFGGAPKFPAHEVNSLLLALGEREMSLTTLKKIADGGIHDQIGGGFCRYAVDSTWTVPHFEKMLYDNALLAAEYLHAWQATGDGYMLSVCRRTLDFMLSELRNGDGGFYASLDADDPGGEGRFYSWTPELVAYALPDPADAELACQLFGITPEGNFEDGLTVAVWNGTAAQAGDEQVDRIRSALLTARTARPRPATDTKVITAWNALAISAFAQAGAVLADEAYLAAAITCAEHLLADLRSPAGRLLRCRTAGRAVIPAMLEDHAMLLAALTDLYEATFDERWFTAAIELEQTTWDLFGDSEGCGYFTTATDGEQLAARRKDIDDQPIPSGNATMALALLRLHGLSGNSSHADRAEGVLRLLAPVAERAPLACGRLLRALLISARGLDEVAIVGANATDLIAEYRSRLRPTSVIASAPITQGSAVPLLSGREAIDGVAAAYVCRNFACRLPVTTTDDLSVELRG